MFIIECFTMQSLRILAILCLTYQAYASRSCGDGWVDINHDKCYKIVDDVARSFADAEAVCNSLLPAQEVGLSGKYQATMARVESVQEQTFLAKYLFDITAVVDNFWLGASYADDGYRWVRTKQPLSYTNWAANSPTFNKTDHCVEMIGDPRAQGRWDDVPCKKKNMVVCQRVANMTHEDMVDKVRQLAKHVKLLQTLKVEPMVTKLASVADVIHREINDLSSQIAESVKQSPQPLEDLKQSIIPVGYIYTQLPNQSEPMQLWPWFTWTEVDSSQYGGVFWRVLADNGTEPFGSVQEASIPRIDQLQYQSIWTEPDRQQLKLPESGWSEYIFTGCELQDREMFFYYHEFHVDGDKEIRPRNMAVRIWQRVK